MDAAAPTPTPDILGEPWVARRIPVTDAAAAPGADHAVLVHQRQAVPAPGAAPRHPRAVLYLHGRNDYFFQMLCHWFRGWCIRPDTQNIII